MACSAPSTPTAAATTSIPRRQAVDKSTLTQVGRALSQLGIQHIPSSSPEARGRMERLFQTFQGRLPHELRAAAITDIEAATRYLREVFLPVHNARFAVAEDGTAFVPYAGQPLNEMLSVHQECQVGRDNCVRYGGLILQIPPQAYHHHRHRAPLPGRHARRPA